MREEEAGPEAETESRGVLAFQRTERSTQDHPPDQSLQLKEADLRANTPDLLPQRRL